MEQASDKLRLMQQKLLAELRRDKKKTVIMAGLIVVACCLGLRILLRNDAPAPAAAAGVSPAPTGMTIADEVEAAEIQQHRRQYIRDMDKTITRDIFQPNEKVFPTSADGGGAYSVFVSTNGAGELTIEEIRAQAGKLSLQTTMLTDEPAAIINGKALRIGESIDGFRIVQINSRDCVVEKDGVKLKLQMRQK